MLLVYVTNEYCLQVPNALGIVLGLVQLTLFCKYPQRKSTLPGRTVSTWYVTVP